MLVLFVVTGVLLGSLAVGAWLFAPWLPTRQRDLDRIGAGLQLTPADVVYDLGCGDGRVVFYLARRFGAETHGVELGIPLFAWCMIKKIVTSAKRASFHYRNFFSVDVSRATVVYLFGQPGTLGQKMVAKLRSELKPGTRVVSYSFPLTGVTPERIDKPSSEELSIYFYRF